MVAYRDLTNAFRRLDIDRSRPILAHASLSAFGHIQGGAETLLGALLSSFDTLVMPAFTYSTMLTPEAGPDHNAAVYGSGRDLNLMAEFFRPDLPAHRLMGALAEALRRHPRARRSTHPILSFVGINADRLLKAQTILEPLAPIRVLSESRGWVLLLGVDHTVNTSIHYAEQLAGRKQFVRWALTPRGVKECPGFPGCSDGFQALAPHVERIVRQAYAGPGRIQAMPVVDLIEAAKACVSADPLALLCERSYCERCQAIRHEATRVKIFTPSGKVSRRNTQDQIGSKQKQKKESAT